MQGWVKIHREIQEHWLWNDKPFSKGQAWIDIILMANHDEKKINIGNEVITVEKGTFITSELKLMERWGWSKSKVRNFLSTCENESMLCVLRDKKKTTLKVLNYCIWQDSETTKEPQKDHERTTERPQKDTNKNVKNIRIKELKNIIYTQDFEDFWTSYPEGGRWNKEQTFKNWNSLISKMLVTVEILIKSAQNYSIFCNDKNVQQPYFKRSTNFLGKEGDYKNYIEYVSNIKNVKHVPNKSDPMEIFREIQKKHNIQKGENK